MRETQTQLVGLLFLVLPLIAIQWNLGRSRGRAPLISPRGHRRWRLEFYSNQANVGDVLIDRADIPFPIKQVQSARGQLAQTAAANAWTLPRLELEIDVDDPFTDEVVSGLFGPDHFVRFVSGNEALIDLPTIPRLRVRALPFR
ncbi:MAG: hypothetical protein OER95_03630 [Acidimicrobiia bacterium]|nr:hypothetical protein [Acidimicrobiia bacterium]